jgi:hypothetical protein
MINKRHDPIGKHIVNAQQGEATRGATHGGGRLKRDIVRPVADLQSAINRFLDHHNAHSKTFPWIADPDKIVAAVRRGHQALDSIH